MHMKMITLHFRRTDGTEPTACDCNIWRLCSYEFESFYTKLQMDWCFSRTKKCSTRCHVILVEGVKLATTRSVSRASHDHGLMARCTTHFSHHCFTSINQLTNALFEVLGTSCLLLTAAPASDLGSGWHTCCTCCYAELLNFVLVVVVACLFPS